MNETPKDWVGGPYPCVQSPLVPPRACMRGNEVSPKVSGPSVVWVQVARAIPPRVKDGPTCGVV